MARYVYYACENIYGGLHGMNICGVVEANSEDEIADIARTAAYEIIESYSCIVDNLEETIAEYITSDMSEDDIDALRSEIYAEDIDYAWHKIDETKAGIYTTKQLDTYAADTDYDYLISTFC